MTASDAHVGSSVSAAIRAGPLCLSFPICVMGQSEQPLTAKEGQQSVSVQL